MSDDSELLQLDQILLDRAGHVLNPAQIAILRQWLIDRNEQQAYLRQHPSAGAEASRER